MTSPARDALVCAVVVAFGVSVLPGCALLRPVDIETDKATLSPAPLAVPKQTNCGATLLVFPPQTQPIYDTTQMAYATQPHQVAYFSRHEWAETPSRMLLPLLVSALQSAGCFNAVVAPPYPYAYTHALRTEIVELLQDFTAQPAVLRLSLRVQLSDDTAGRVIAGKELTLRESMPLRTPEGGVIAANVAAAKTLREVVSFVLAATSSSRSRP
jgi:cholesterol transport system auxiliary component